MKNLLIIFSVILLSYNINGQTTDHSSFDNLLQKYVTSAGRVHYPGFINEIEVLDDYLNNLAKKIPTANTSENDAKAYWLNAYNAFTIKLICDNHPTASIMDIANGKPWDIKFITLQGKKYTLNQIENKIIRPTFKDGRIHFAVNCGAKSCPPLLNKAFNGKNVESLLDKRTRKFINDSAFNKINNNTLELSKIFEWYAGDFNHLITFINKYSKIKVAGNAEIKYNYYDWALNN